MQRTRPAPGTGLAADRVTTHRTRPAPGTGLAADRVTTHRTGPAPGKGLAADRVPPARSLFLVVVACVAFGGCRRASEVVVHDLAAEVLAAERSAGPDVLLFGAPETVARQAKGLIREGPEAADERSVWSRRESEVVVRWDEVRPRAAVLDLAPYPGIVGQAAEVRLNGVPVGRFDVPGRTRGRVSLPPGAQKAGTNRLTLAFDKVAPRGDPSRRRFAAAVYGLTIGAPDEALLAALERPGAPPPFAVRSAGSVPSLVQIGATSIRYAIRLAPGLAFRFTPHLHPSAAGPATLRVTLEDAAGERELWRGAVSSAGPGDEVTVPLDGSGGATVRLGLHVGAGEGGRATWAVWRAPRILGPPPPAEPEDSRLFSLRQWLQGSNVVLVVLDAAGASHFSCYGYGRATTPEIDAIAREGVVFDRAYTPAVYTLAAMGSVWTSLYPDEHHAGGPYDAPLPAGPLTLAELLGANGVATAGFVANGMAGPAFGLDRGFGAFEEIFRKHGANADAFREVVPSWLEAHKDRRFFLYLHFREPHFPYDPPPPFDTRFGPAGPLPKEARTGQGWINRVNAQRVRATPEESEHLVRLYDANLAFADQEVGALRRSLEAAGLWDRTVFVVTADHGEALLEHGFIGHNIQLYEESVRVPLVVRFPKRRGPAGVRAAGLVDLLDLAPTIAEVFGVMGKGGSSEAFRGRSLLPVALGAPGKPAVFARSATGERPSHAIRDDRHTFIRNSRYGHEWLYDRAADPRELQDLVSTAPLEAAYQRQSLFRWMLGLRRGATGEPGQAQLSPEQRENLRALGYVN